MPNKKEKVKKKDQIRHSEVNILSKAKTTKKVTTGGLRSQSKMSMIFPILSEAVK